MDLSQMGGRRPVFSISEDVDVGSFGQRRTAVRRSMRRASFVFKTRPINALTEALGAARLDAA
jgi:hypothetical protein